MGVYRCRLQYLPYYRYQPGLLACVSMTAGTRLISNICWLAYTDPVVLLHCMTDEAMVSITLNSQWFTALCQLHHCLFTALTLAL